MPTIYDKRNPKAEDHAYDEERCKNDMVSVIKPEILRKKIYKLIDGRKFRCLTVPTQNPEGLVGGEYLSDVGWKGIHVAPSEIESEWGSE